MLFVDYVCEQLTGARDFAGAAKVLSIMYHRFTVAPALCVQVTYCATTVAKIHHLQRQTERCVYFAHCMVLLCVLLLIQTSLEILRRQPEHRDDLLQFYLAAIQENRLDVRLCAMLVRL